MLRMEDFWTKVQISMQQLLVRKWFHRISDCVSNKSLLVADRWFWEKIWNTKTACFQRLHEWPTREEEPRLSVQSIRHHLKQRCYSLVFPEYPPIYPSSPFLSVSLSSREIIAPFTLRQPTSWPRRSPTVLFVNADHSPISFKFFVDLTLACPKESFKRATVYLQIYRFIATKWYTVLTVSLALRRGLEIFARSKDLCAQKSKRRMQRAELYETFEV